MDVRHVALVVVALSLASPALAQGGGRPCESCGRGQMARSFDPRTVQTVKGKIVAVRTIDGRRNHGVHVDLETSKGTLDAHLGPSWYLDDKGLALQNGDALQITGSKTTFDGKPAIIAQTVKKGSQTLALRDGSGVPLWRGHGPRS